MDTCRLLSFHLVTLVILHNCKLTLGRATPHLTDTDLKHYVKDPSTIKEYNVFVPTVVHGERHRRSKANGHATQLTFTAFEEGYQLILINAPRFFSPDLKVDHVFDNGTIVKEEMPVDADCFYHGQVVSHNASGAAITIYDDQIRGMFSSGEDTVFITPLNQEHAHVYARRFKRSPREMHLIYKRDITDLPRSCYVKDAQEDFIPGDILPQVNPANLENSFVPPKYLEMNLMLDVDFVNRYTPDHVLIATTIVNAVSRRYSDPSLGLSIRLYIVEMMVLTGDTVTQTNPDATFTISGDFSNTNNPDALDSIQQWSQLVNNPDDSNPGHWDNIAVLTGKDISLDGDQTTVGVASGIGTCVNGYGISFTEDLGLESAFVMAHEIGHTFTLPHDDDPSEGCASGFIMSASLPNGPNSFRWSSCSREDLINYLRWQRPNPRSDCMNDVPVGLNPLTTLQLPGELLRFSLDQQCALLDDNDVACGTIDCSNLQCRPASNPNICASMFVNVAEGTSCGSNMVCLAGACVSRATIPVPVDGGWSTWTETECSRTCSGGVLIRQRVCNNPVPVWGGAPCVGNGVEFRLCNFQRCANSPDDFRDEQCAATDLNGDGYVWTSTGPMQFLAVSQFCRNPCHLPDSSFSARPPFLNDDGTECWDYSAQDANVLLRCVGSICETFGCDGTQGSGQEFDVCRVCNGDGSTCQRQTLSAPTPSIGEIQNFATQIPAGATSILITINNMGGQIVNSPSIAGVTSGQLFGGSNTIDFTPRAFLGNFVITHELDVPSGEEIFRSPGPIPEAVTIQSVLTSTPTSTSTISIEYYMQLTGNFFWNIGPFGACSATCDGMATRTVTCISEINGIQTTVADNVCEGAVGPKPDTATPCQVGLCPVWVPGDFGQCNVVCGSGSQTREVTCRQNDVSINDIFCDSLQRPPSQQTCEVGSCNWVPGAFGPCSVSCGSGTQVRTVVCMNNIGTVPNSNCLLPMPATTQICTMPTCPNESGWFTGPFGSCNVDCGTGIQTRSVTCRFNIAVVEDSLCQSLIRPSSERACDVGSCSWVAGPYSPCSVTCDQGTQSRSVVCMNAIGPVAAIACPIPIPQDTRGCNNRICSDEPRWVIASAFGECSSKCGKGTQRRSVECRVGIAVVGDYECERVTMPNKVQVCISLRCLLGDNCDLLDNPFIRRGS